MFKIPSYFFFVTFAAAQLSINPLQHSSPVLFNRLGDAHISYDDFRFLFYVNLTNYFNLEHVVEAGIKMTDLLCSNESTYSDSCNTTRAIIVGHLGQIKNDDEKLEIYRSKRTICEWCGEKMNYLFGVVDAEHARELAENHNRLTNETQMNYVLIQNSTAINRAYFKINNENWKRLNATLNSMQKNIEKHNIAFTAMDMIFIRMTLNEIVSVSNAAVLEHNHYYSQLRRVLSDSHSARIPELISNQELLTMLHKVLPTLSEKQRFPVDVSQNPMALFRFCTTSAYIHDNLLFVTLTIKIAEREKFSLYKATPIPIDTQNGRIILSIRITYFLLNDEESKFIPLDLQEINKGTMIASNQYLYRTSAEIYLESKSVCEWNLFAQNDINAALETCKILPFPQNDVFMTIIDGELYFSSSFKAMRVWEYCDTRSRHYDVVGRNIIKVDSKCWIKTAQRAFRSHRVHIINETELIEPRFSSTEIEFNHFMNISVLSRTIFNSSISPSIPLVITDQAEMQDLLKDAEKLVESSRHKFHVEQMHIEQKSFSTFAVLGGSIISLGTICTLIFVFRKVCMITSFLTAAYDTISLRARPSTPHPNKRHNRDNNDED